MAQPEHRRPNVLWFSFEDTNPFYGCYGDPVAVTPNLDRLASEGCLWTDCYSTAGVCAPARSAIITGMYAMSIGTHHMRTTHVDPAAPDLPTPYSAVIPHYVKCFTEYLRAEGYYCTNNSKTDYQFDPPVTAWDECSDTAHWRNRPDPDQPFFAVFNPMRTHESGLWEPDTIPPAGTGKSGGPPPGEEHAGAPGAGNLPPIDPARIVVPPTFPDTPRVRASLVRMYENIARSDAELGEVLAQLAEDGLADNTIVMHWSDHGPLPRGKRWPYDAGIHVPLIVRWPSAAGNPGASLLPGGGLAGFDPGTVCGHLVSTIDLGPTLLDLVGIPRPSHLQGQPFLGPHAEPRQYVFAERDRHDTSYDMVRAARDNRFKYIRHYRPGEPYLSWIPYRDRHPIMQELYAGHADGTLTAEQQLIFASKPPEELYDTEADPWEFHNLAGDPDYADDLARLRLAVDDWRDEVGDMGEIPEREMVNRWYPGGIQPVTAAPIIVPVGAANPASGHEAHRLTAPARLELHCSTQGASIAWRFDTDPSDRWRLYVEPIRLERGETAISCKAIRIGYRESEVTTAHFAVDSDGVDVVR